MWLSGFSQGVTYASYPVATLPQTRKGRDTLCSTSRNVTRSWQNEEKIYFPTFIYTLKFKFNVIKETLQKRRYMREDIKSSKINQQSL